VTVNGRDNKGRRWHADDAVDLVNEGVKPNTNGRRQLSDWHSPDTRYLP